MRRFGRILGLIILYACALFSASFIGVTIGFEILMNWFFVQWIVFTAITDFYVGCAEETMFRYLLMDKLFTQKWKLPGYTPVVLSSVLFGLAHLMNGPWPLTLPQVVWTTIGGFVFGWIYNRHGLGWAAGMHALHNFLVHVGFWSILVSLFA